MDVLDRIVNDIIAQQPDHVALTGDLVNVGHPEEFLQAFSRVSPLGGHTQVSIIPGNHDAYIGESLPAMIRTFGSFMLGDDASTGAHPTFPYLRKRGKVALIGVSTGVPTLPFMATGRIGQPQMERLGALLAQTRNEGLFRIVMIHHPPLVGSAKFGRGLRDAPAFEAVMRQHGAELVLHGHNHRYSLRQTTGPKGMVPVLGVASASAVPGTPHHLAEYNLIRITPENQKIEIIRRGISGHDSNVQMIDQKIISI